MPEKPAMPSKKLDESELLSRWYMYHLAPFGPIPLSMAYKLDPKEASWANRVVRKPWEVLYEPTGQLAEIAHSFVRPQDIRRGEIEGGRSGEYWNKYWKDEPKAESNRGRAEGGLPKTSSPSSDLNRLIESMGGMDKAVASGMFGEQPQQDSGSGEMAKILPMLMAGLGLGLLSSKMGGGKGGGIEGMAPMIQMMMQQKMSEQEFLRNQQAEFAEQQRKAMQDSLTQMFRQNVISGDEYIKAMTTGEIPESIARTDPIQLAGLFKDNPEFQVSILTHFGLMPGGSAIPEGPGGAVTLAMQVLKSGARIKNPELARAAQEVIDLARRGQPYDDAWQRLLKGLGVNALMGVRGGRGSVGMSELQERIRAFAEAKEGMYTDLVKKYGPEFTGRADVARSERNMAAVLSLLASMYGMPTVIKSFMQHGMPPMDDMGAFQQAMAELMAKIAQSKLEDVVRGGQPLQDKNIAPDTQ